MNSDDPVLRLMEDVEKLKVEIKRLAAQRQVYNIVNPANEVQISSNQNNYSVGDYDILYIEPTGADRTINGLTGGVDGRMLWILNSAQSGSFNLLFTHQNAAATAENRIATTTAGTITLGGRKLALFAYDRGVVTGTPRWIMFLPPA